MTTIDDSRYMAYRVVPGDASSADPRRKPQVLPDGSVALDAADGSSPVIVKARHFFRHVGLVTADLTPTEVAAQLVAPKLWTSWPDLVLVVTDARVVFVSSQPEDDGSYSMAGQIRYPWIQSIDFAPKRGIFSDNELRIEVQEMITDSDPADSGFFAHTFTFHFDKNFHPGELARDIAQRTARYLARTQPVDAQDRLAELAQIGPLPDPRRGDHASYVPPVRTSFPHGHFGLGDGEDGGQWTYSTGPLFV